MAYYTPTPNQSGLFTLKEPFLNALVSGRSYTVVAVRTMSDLSVNGVDPFEQLYVPNGLSRETYQAELAAGVMLVTLQAGDGISVDVPNSYIVGAPVTGGVPYMSMMLMLDLSILPSTVDLSHLKDKLVADVADLIGVSATIQPIVASSPLLLGPEQAAVAESTRAARIATSTTDYAELVKVRAQLQRALDQNAALSQYILDNHIPPPVTP